MESLPTYVYLLFIAVTVLTLIILYKAFQKNKTIFIVSILWLVIQAFLGLSGFYTKTDAIPPRLVFMLMPPLVMITILFVVPGMRSNLFYSDGRLLTLLHTVRLPVEIVLFFLFLHGQIPELMTFEGRNFDIFAGITAPFIAYLGYTKKVVSNTILFLWNFICLGLLLNIIVNGILSAPTSFQQFAFDQPNIAVAYFPFVWLPSFIVPVVFLSNLINIFQLMKNRKTRLNELEVNTENKVVML